jgi:acetyl esterase/lipase
MYRKAMAVLLILVCVPGYGWAMDIQRILLKTIALLPESVLRRLGGTPIEIRGVPLDPMMQLIWAQGVKEPGVETLSPAEVRHGLDTVSATLQAAVPSGVNVREETIPGPGGAIPVRVYAPRNADGKRPITIFFHFGGYVIGSRNICDGFCGLMSDRADSVVVNVEYRLAPEHPFPAPVEDALAVYQWLIEHGDDVGGDAKRIAVAGDSAGAQLAAIIAQEAKRENFQAPLCQLLIYPWLVPHSGMPSYEDYGEAYPLNAAIMDWFGNHYFSDDDQKEHAWAAPLNESDLSGLAEAIVVTAGYDPLRDEGEAYAKRLEEAGVTTFFRCYEHLTHSFTMFGGVVPATQQAMIEIADELKKRLHP